MTHFVTEACIRCKFTDCVDVCPVDCFYEGVNMLVIRAEECTDCGACLPACPVGAIRSESGAASDARWLKLNKEYSRLWPSITVRILPPPNAEAMSREKDKLEKYFSPKSGGGSEWFIQKRPSE